MITPEWLGSGITRRRFIMATGLATVGLGIGACPRRDNRA